MNIQKRVMFALLILLTLGFLSGCSSDDDDDPKQASVIPAINPAFNDVTAITMSATVDGTYEATTSFTYDSTTEKITFSEGAIPSGGVFVKITGPVTNHGMTMDHTVMTFISSNSDNMPAHELTTMAAAKIANGDATTWAAALTSVAHHTGLSEDDITAMMTAHQRSDYPNLVETLKELSENSIFMSDSITTADLTTFAGVTAPNMDKIAWGAILYDNWMKSPESAPALIAEVGGADAHAGHGMKPSARSTTGHSTEEDKQPALLQVQVGGEHLVDAASSGSEHEGFRRFARCAQCHGYDQMGDTGGFKDRTRSSKTLYVDGNSTGGDFDRRPLPASIDLNSSTITDAAITSQTSGAMYANISTAITGTDAVDAATNWNAALSAASDAHPDYTPSTSTSDAADVGEHNDIVPTEDQIAAITAFLNYEGGKASKVFTISDGAYTLKTMHGMTEQSMAEAGEVYYANYCFRCHGAPDNANGNPLSGKGGNFNGYLTSNSELNDTRLGTLMHFARWGKPSGYMNRSRIGAPTSHDVANLVAYLKANQAGTYSSPAANGDIGNIGAGDAEAGKAMYNSGCLGCHSAHNGDDTTGTDEDVTALCADHDNHDADLVPMVDGACPTGTDEVPNLAFKHPGLIYDLGSLSSKMSHISRLSQEHINNLAAFLAGVRSAQ